MFYRKKKTENGAEKKKKKQQIPPPPPSADSSFFYSNVNQLDQLDDHLFFESIFAKYPQLETLSEEEADDLALKEAITALLSDEAFVDRLLNYFRLTQYDFFKLICQRWGLVFKGMFLRKIQKLIAA